MHAVYCSLEFVTAVCVIFIHLFTEALFGSSLWLPCHILWFAIPYWSFQVCLLKNSFSVNPHAALPPGPQFHAVGLFLFSLCYRCYSSLNLQYLGSLGNTPPSFFQNLPSYFPLRFLKISLQVPWKIMTVFWYIWLWLYSLIFGK